MQFKSKEIEQIIGLKQNTLHYYIKAGVITPDIDEGRGTGTSRLFSERNLIECTIIKRLISMGYPKRFIEDLFKGMDNSGERVFLAPEKIMIDDYEKFILVYPIQDGCIFRFLTLSDKHTKIEIEYDTCLVISLTKICKLLKHWFGNERSKIPADRKSFKEVLSNSNS